MNLSVSKKLLCLSVLLAISLFACPLDAFAQAGGVGGRPAHPDPDNPRTNSIFIYTLDKNDSRSDAVLVANNTKDPQTIELYATDAAVSNTGAFTCKQNVEARVDVGSWVELAKTEVTLQPGTKEEVPFTVKVPAVADVGEHNGCLVFQVKDDGGVTEGNVRIRTRSAIRMSVTIPGNLERKISITSFSVDQQNDGSQIFRLSAQNVGNVSADINSEVTLKTLFGTSVYTNGGEYPVLAGKKLDLNFVNEKPPFWGGLYIVQAKVSYDKRPGTFGTADASQLISEETAKEYLFVAPTSTAVAIYIAALVAILATIGYMTYRRHNRKHTLKKWQTHIVEQGETMQSLATSHDISWQKLAKTNAIKPPYVLEPGAKIKLPIKSKR